MLSIMITERVIFSVVITIALLIFFFKILVVEQDEKDENEK